MPPAALSALRESLKIRRGLAAQDPRNAQWQNEVAIDLSKVGEVLLAQGAHADALASHTEAAEISRRLAAQDPGNARWQGDLSAALGMLGDTQAAQGEFAAALASHRESLEIRRRLAAQDAGNVQRHGAVTFIQDKIVAIALLSGEVAPTTPAHHLALGTALRRRKEYVASAEHFATALESAEVRADLGAGVLYAATRSAALASGAVEGEEALRWRAKAMEWLAEDLRLRRARLRALDQAGPPTPESVSAIEKERRALLAHFDRVRTSDPDLAALRGTPEFEAAFESK